MYSDASESTFFYKVVAICCEARAFILYVEETKTVEIMFCLVNLFELLEDNFGLRDIFYCLPTLQALEKMNNYLFGVTLFVMFSPVFFQCLDSGWQLPFTALDLAVREVHDSAHNYLRSGKDLVASAYRCAQRVPTVTPSSFLTYERQAQSSEKHRIAFSQAASSAPLLSKIALLRKSRTIANAQHEHTLSHLRQVIVQCHVTEQHLRWVISREVARYEYTYNTLNTKQSVHLAHDKRIHEADVKKQNAATERCKVLEEIRVEVEKERNARRILEDATSQMAEVKAEPNDGTITESFTETVAKQEFRNVGRCVLLQHTIAEQKEQMKTMKKEYNHTLRLRGSEKALVDGKLQKAKTEIKALRGECAYLLKELDEGKVAIEDLRQGQLNTNTNTSKQADPQVPRELQAEVDTLRQELSGAKAEYERILGHSKNVQLQLTEQADALQGEKRTAKRALLKEFEVERAAHRKEMEEMKKELMEMKMECERARELPPLLLHKMVEKEDKAIVTDDADDDAGTGFTDRDLEEELNSLRTALTKEQKHSSDVSTSNVSLQTQLSSRLTTLDVLCTQLARESEKVQELQKELVDKSKERELVSLRAYLQTMVREREEARREMLLAKGMMYELNVEVKGLWARLEEVEMEKAVWRLVDGDVGVRGLPGVDGVGGSYDAKTPTAGMANTTSSRATSAGSFSGYSQTGNRGPGIATFQNHPYHQHFPSGQPVNLSALLPIHLDVPGSTEHRNGNFVALNGDSHSNLHLPARRAQTAFESRDVLYDSGSWSGYGAHAGYHSGLGHSVATGYHPGPDLVSGQVQGPGNNFGGGRPGLRPRCNGAATQAGQGSYRGIDLLGLLK